MTITLTLPPETERKLKEHAAQSGQSVERFLQQLVEREVLGSAGKGATAPHAGMTFDEILAPVRQGFQESGLSEAELDQLFEEAREEARQERQRHTERP